MLSVHKFSRDPLRGEVSASEYWNGTYILVRIASLPLCLLSTSIH